MKSVKTLPQNEISNTFKSINRALLLSSICMVSACQLFDQHEIAPEDLVIRDSLYVVSDDYKHVADNEAEPIEYQSIRTVGQNLLKSDVDLLFEVMVNNEIVGIDPLDHSETQVNDTSVSVPKAQTIASTNQVDTTVQVSQKPLTKLVSEKTEQKTKRPEVQFEETVNEQQIAEVNRLTATQPTAAGIPTEAVVPQLKNSPVETNLPNEIYLLAQASEYHPSQYEFGMWQIAKEKSVFNEQCTLRSATVQLDLGNYTAQVWFDVVGNELLVNSTTNIDIQKPKVGVKVDNGALQSFRKKYFENGAVWSGDLSAVLVANQQLSITLGGSELGNRTPEFAVGLRDLKKAYAEYSKCNKEVRFGSL